MEINTDQMQDKGKYLDEKFKKYIDDSNFPDDALETDVIRLRLSFSEKLITELLIRVDHLENEMMIIKRDGKI